MTLPSSRSRSLSGLGLTDALVKRAPMGRNRCRAWLMQLGVWGVLQVWTKGFRRLCLALWGLEADKWLIVLELG